MGSGKVDLEERFYEIVGKPIKIAIPLEEHSSFKIGGKADYFFVAFSVTDLVRAVNLARELSIPYFVIGGGYNLLFDDDGFRGLIIKNRVMGIEQRGKTKVQTLTGTPLPELLTFCVDKGLRGLEFLAGIPGTVGGAVSGNAGAFDQAIGDLLTEALLLNEKGERVEVGHDYFSFDYRYSRLRTCGELLLKATFELEEGDKKKIKSRIAENLAKRAKKQPSWDIACAGSYFKNPVLPDGKRVPAAYLLDQVGAKNVEVGGASVFKNHANFIINQREATSQNILNLAQELKRRVREKFGIELEEEVIFLSAKLSKT